MTATSAGWTAIGRVRNDRPDPADTDHWGDLVSVIEVDEPRFGPGALHILGVEGPRLTVQGLDAVDGTQVLDLKPVVREFLPGPVRQPRGWASC